jgi:hypothetical protein
VLTVEGIRAHLERLSYKDGWSFDVYEGRWEGPHIVIRTEVQDALLRGRRTVLDVHSFLPPMRDTLALEEWLADRLKRLEIHEMREFFKRDGRVIFDPHAPDADHDRR